MFAQNLLAKAKLMTKDLPQEDHPDDDAGLYVISVAAELSGLHPQTLRQYDRLGLVSPDRTVGRNRQIFTSRYCIPSYGATTCRRRNQPRRH